MTELSTPSRSLGVDLAIPEKIHVPYTSVPEPIGARSFNHESDVGLLGIAVLILFWLRAQEQICRGIAESCEIRLI
jgi:hypothetical protein